MGWKKARQQFLERKGLTEQKTEDMIARRVLRGMGLVQRQLSAAERSVCGTVSADDPLWDRVSRVLRIALVRRHKLRRVDDWNIEIHDSDAKGKEILERLEFVKDFAHDHSMHPVPVIFARIRDTKNMRAYMPVWPETLPDIVEAPFAVPVKLGWFWILVQDVEEFVKQLGPYQWDIPSD